MKKTLKKSSVKKIKLNKVIKKIVKNSKKTVIKKLPRKINTKKNPKLKVKLKPAISNITKITEETPPIDVAQEVIPMHQLTEEQQMSAVFETFPPTMKEIVQHRD